MRENKVGKRVAFIVLAIVCIVWIFPLIWAILPLSNQMLRSKKLALA